MIGIVTNQLPVDWPVSPANARHATKESFNGGVIRPPPFMGRMRAMTSEESCVVTPIHGLKLEVSE